MTSTQARHSPQALHTLTEGSAHDAVRLTGLRKSFGTVDAVKGIDLSIRPGEIVAFLGPNGAGKTTTIDMILGLSRPTSGEVSVFGMSPRSAIARGLVSAVMQTGGLLKELTVAETVQLTASLYSQSRPVDEVLGRAGILDISDRLVSKCSGGQQQRLRFAMALLSNPQLLILDEPTTGMDVEGRRDFGPPSAPTQITVALCFLRRTTSKRPMSTPTASSWSGKAPWSQTGPPPRSRRWRPGAPCARLFQASPTNSCEPYRTPTPSRCAVSRYSCTRATPMPLHGSC